MYEEILFSLTVDFVHMFHFWLVVKIFPNEATSNEGTKYSEKNNEKVIIVE